MPRNVSLLELRTRAQQLSDTENDVNISTAEWNALANRHIPKVYDMLVDAGPADYYAATTQITTSDGVIEYALPASFRNLVAVYMRESADERRPILAMREATRANYKAPTGSWTLDVEYIPTPPTLEDDGDTFDGVSGWDELIVALMARDVMAKRESDPSVVMSIIASEQARIVARSRKRDRGPRWVVDLDETTERPFPYYYSNNSRIACYRLRADNLELYEPLWGFP